MVNPWIEVDGYEPCRSERCAILPLHPAHAHSFKVDDDPVPRWRSQRRSERAQKEAR